MKIEKVVYELYESDYSCIRGHENSDMHEIDREICLDLEDGRHIYVTWVSEPVQYAVGYKEGRWNVNEPDILIEASEWKIWRPLIKKNCEFIYHDEWHQILELKCNESSIYFSSQEEGSWLSDVLHISATKPVCGN